MAGEMDFGEIDYLEHEQRFKNIQESQDVDKNREKLQVGKIYFHFLFQKKNFLAFRFFIKLNYYVLFNVIIYEIILIVVLKQKTSRIAL